MRPSAVVQSIAHQRPHLFLSFPPVSALVLLPDFLNEALAGPRALILQNADPAHAVNGVRNGVLLEEIEVLAVVVRHALATSQDIYTTRDEPYCARSLVFLDYTLEVPLLRCGDTFQADKNTKLDVDCQPVDQGRVGRQNLNNAWQDDLHAGQMSECDGGRLKVYLGNAEERFTIGKVDIADGFALEAETLQSRNDGKLARVVIDRTRRTLGLQQIAKQRPDMVAKSSQVVLV